METIENVEFTYGECLEYILIREKDLEGNDINLLLTEHELKHLVDRAERKAQVIPENNGNFLSRWFR